jgi:hypothetical protein
MDVKTGDEVVRIDRSSNQITFTVRRADKSLARFTLLRPIWTHIKEIGFIVSDLHISEPDLAVVEGIRRSHPQASVPTNLRQVRVMDHEEAKISVIYADEVATEL